jgi:glucosamine--fructose-6-phosphate aminotransferase (isomerizing)
MQIKHGETFSTETDTEVIPKLCKFVYDRLSEKVPFPKVGVVSHARAV